MRMFLFSLAVAALPASAATAQPQPAQGYEVEPLGAAAIERQDWTAAERELRAAGLRSDDPAKLINLGRIYMETGRTEAALAAWRRALAADEEYMVQTASGETVSTRELARRALNWHQRNTRTVSALR